MGLGRTLKEYQRRVLAERGVTRIFWTFDPLMAKNAYFNLNRLGVRVVEYVPDMYGTTGSPLHLGLATDRLVVASATTAQGSAAFVLPAPPNERAPILTPFARLNDTTITTGSDRPPSVLLEIPQDVLDVLAKSPTAARTWRVAVRDHFTWALTHGYAVRGVHRSSTSGRTFYVMTRDPKLAPGAHL